MILQLLFLGMQVFGEDTVKGRVLEKGARVPFKDITVFVLPEKKKTKTQEDGTFSMELPPGNHDAIVNIPGYEFTKVNFTSPGEIEILVPKSAYNPFETTVETKASTIQTSQKNISAVEASKIAGTGGDAIKAVSTLPGVARSSFSGSNVIIRGSAPDDTGYLIDGHQVPIIFHFGGFSSVVNTDLLDEIIYLPGGFGSPYGRFNGGFVGVRTRNPKDDGTHGYVFMDIINGGFLLESPLGSGWSFGITGRRSYIGDVFKLIAKNNKAFDFTLAPYFYDGLATLSKKIDENQNVKLTYVGSYDELSFLLKEPSSTQPAIRGPFNNITKFWRTILTYDYKISPDDNFHFTSAYGNDSVSIDVSELSFNINRNATSTRSEWNHRFNLFNRTRIGIDNQYANGEVKFKLPVFDGTPINRTNLIEGQTRISEANVGTFIEHRVGVLEDPEKWTLTPGLRYDHFRSTRENLVSPRLASRFEIDPIWALRMGTGIYYQSPDPRYTDEVYGNTQIKAPMSIHYVLGFETKPQVSWLNTFSLESDVFFKDLNKEIVSDPVLKYSNEGRGKVYGLELFSKATIGQWTGQLSYTLSRSTRQSPAQSESTFQYDQTHNITFVGSVKTATQLEFGVRGRYVTGNPATPNVGARLDSDQDAYIGSRGTPYSTRLPSFFQLDFRLDRKWVYTNWILNAYLDIQNITNNKNVESITYSYDFSEKAYVTGLPIIPSFGLRAEF